MSEEDGDGIQMLNTFVGLVSATVPVYSINFLHFRLKNIFKLWKGHFFNIFLSGKFYTVTAYVL